MVATSSLSGRSGVVSLTSFLFTSLHLNLYSVLATDCSRSDSDDARASVTDLATK